MSVEKVRIDGVEGTGDLIANVVTGEDIIRLFSLAEKVEETTVKEDCEECGTAESNCDCDWY